MAASVLRELEDLQRSFRATSPYSYHASHHEKKPHNYGSPSAGTIKSYSTALHNAERNVERLGRAIDAADQEMEGAMARSAEVRRGQLRQREAELCDLQRALGAKERALDELRGALAAQRRCHDAQVQQLEEIAAHRAVEVGALSAEVVALRADNEALQQRVERATSSTARAEQRASSREQQLAASLARAQAECNTLSAALEMEAKQKEMLQREVADAKGDVERALCDKSDVVQQLAGCQEELQLVRDKLRAEQQGGQEARQQLQQRLREQLVQQEQQGQLVQELQQRLRGEHAARKAAEKWLKAELRAREDLESLLAAVKELALARSVPSPSAVRDVDRLLHELHSRQGECAEQHQADFMRLRKALDADSSRIRSEAAAARKLLAEHGSAGSM